MKVPTVRTLVVDDYEPWRRFTCLTLQADPRLQVIREVGDGFEAVRQAQVLQPDLILLDLGLPTLNGIEAARKIRQVSPSSKILFLSEHRSRAIAEEALRAGALGYVVKSDASRDLLPAVEAVLQGRQFVSMNLTTDDFGGHPDPKTGYRPLRGDPPIVLPAPRLEPVCHHEAGFYSDDRRFLEHFTQFVGAALKRGDAAIVLATELHREALLPRLHAHGLDVAEAIEHGRYIATDAAQALSTFMRDGMPDSVLFAKAFGSFILTAAKSAKTEHPRVAVCGECAHLVWAQGNAGAALQIERLANQLIKAYDVDILCAYFPSAPSGRMDNHVFQRICAEHSAAHSS